MCSGDFLSIAIDSIRRELEYSDLPSALFMMSSIGGGTGSGYDIYIIDNVYHFICIFDDFVEMKGLELK
jgi:hypothetical protein